VSTITKAPSRYSASITCSLPRTLHFGDLRLFRRAQNWIVDWLSLFF
jgi:hypothetical protein